MHITVTQMYATTVVKVCVRVRVCVHACVCVCVCLSEYIQAFLCMCVCAPIQNNIRRFETIYLSGLNSSGLDHNSGL